MSPEQLLKLRRVINENLRVQRGGADPIPYIDVTNAVGDVISRQNHAVFGRRGCGKSLLLHHSSRNLPENIKAVYLNCEDFKKHSYPNVLIEILDALFAELESHLTGWFGRKKRSRELIKSIRGELVRLREKADEQEREIREATSKQTGKNSGVAAGAERGPFNANFEKSINRQWNEETEQKYRVSHNKIQQLDKILPQLKRQIREFFETSTTVNSVFLQIDDFYHLNRSDQPLVMDYIHRLCKDLSLYFKVATLRHATILYADRDGQPLGAQERHDYQPVNVDFDFSNLRRTQDQNRRIFHEFGRLASITNDDVDGLFKGEGFERLILAGGGVPRDCLSLFLELLHQVQPPASDGRIGKDDVRILSRANFERRIEELKQDSDSREQGVLIQGIYVLRKFCIDKQTNIILVPEQLLQQDDRIRELLYRLLDYRILHTAGSAMTHKSHDGTYHAFVIDVGCYAHMRKLQGKFVEIDLGQTNSKEKMRSGPILDEKTFTNLWQSAPEDPEAELLADDGE